MRAAHLKQQLSESQVNITLLNTKVANLEEAHAEELKKLQEDFETANHSLVSQLSQERQTGTSFMDFPFLVLAVFAYFCLFLFFLFFGITIFSNATQTTLE